MLNFTVKLESVKDLVELKKIAKRYDINGKMEQNGFHGDMKSVFRDLIYLPLDHVKIEIDDYSESQVPYITEAMSKLTA